MNITLHSTDFKKAWKCTLSLTQGRRLDNGHLVSIGLILGEDIKEATLKKWIKKGIAREIDPEKAKHSGCLSRCILRGHSICQW